MLIGKSLIRRIFFFFNKYFDICFFIASFILFKIIHSTMPKPLKIFPKFRSLPVKMSVYTLTKLLEQRSSFVLFDLNQSELFIQFRFSAIKFSPSSHLITFTASCEYVIRLHESLAGQFLAQFA